ncbi:hypothetical protein CUMW_240970 [Citrus unshiu]|uniref:Ubiquitin-like domain-containing protein n=1 Tax=Citrus unshiu TaxID=55188 RepID=A0A2H5QLB8_CITUN|nr:hypothetical protein CUMW_240970 [Citrus unshiu]
MTKRVWGLHNPSPMDLSPGRLIKAVNPTCTLYTGPGFRLPSLVMVPTYKHREIWDLCTCWLSSMPIVIDMESYCQWLSQRGSPVGLASCSGSKRSRININAKVKKTRAMKNLYFKTPSNEKTIELEANSSDVFHMIKSIIEKKAGIHSYDHLFYYNGNLISDTRSLDSLSISGKEATLQMIFEPNDGVKIVEDTTNLPNEDWDLFIGRIRLQNVKTISYYDINENEKLKMLPAMYQISLRTCIGETITLEVTQVDTISDVKENFFKETDVPVIAAFITWIPKCLSSNRDDITKDLIFLRFLISEKTMVDGSSTDLRAFTGVANLFVCLDTPV